MIRSGKEYRARLRDGREIWVEGERVRDVTTHPAFKPVVDLKARTSTPGPALPGEIDEIVVQSLET